MNQVQAAHCSSPHFETTISYGQYIDISDQIRLKATTTRIVHVGFRVSISEPFSFSR